MLSVDEDQPRCSGLLRSVDRHFVAQCEQTEGLVLTRVDSFGEVEERLLCFACRSRLLPEHKGGWET